MGGGSAGDAGTGARSGPMDAAKPDVGASTTQPEQEPAPAAKGAKGDESVLESIDRLQKMLKEKREKLARTRLLEVWAPQIEQAVADEMRGACTIERVRELQAGFTKAVDEELKEEKEEDEEMASLVMAMEE